jgi:hypothetical protein
VSAPAPDASRPAGDNGDAPVDDRHAQPSYEPVIL